MKHKKRLNNLLAASLSIGLLFAANTYAQDNSTSSDTKHRAPSAPPKVLKFNTIINPYLINGHTYFLDKMFNPLFDTLYKKSNGVLQPKYYLPNELTPFIELYDSVVTGKADMGFTVIIPSDQEKLPISSLFMLARVDQFTHRPAYAAWRMLNEWPEMQQEWDDVKVLFQFDESNGGIATVSKPIHSVEDIKGLRLVCFSNMAAKQVEALGGIPIFEYSSIDAMINLLKTGEADGMVHNLPGFLADYGFAPYLKYSVDLRIGSIFAYTIMNKKTWEGMTEEEKEAIDSVFNKEAFILGDTAMKEMNANNYRRLKDDFGVQRIHMSAKEKVKAAKLLQPVREEYAKFLDSKGYDGKDLIKRFDQVMAEYAE